MDQQLEISENKARDLKLDIQKFTSKLELLNEKIYTKRKNHSIEESEYEHEQADLSERLRVSDREEFPFFSIDFTYFFLYLGS